VLLGLGTPVGVGAAGLPLQYLTAPTTMLVLGAGLALAVAVFATQRKLLQARWPGEARGLKHRADCRKLARRSANSAAGGSRGSSPMG
jgi:hypothetical protein